MVRLFFEKLLSSSVTCTESEQNPLENIRQDNSNALVNQAITELEIREVFLPCTQIKSPGPDGVCSELLKLTIDYTCFSYVAYLMKYETKVMPPNLLEKV